MQTPRDDELEAHARSLRSLARALVGASDADDLVQDAAVQWLRTRDLVHAPLAYLRTAIRGLAAKLHRREARRRANEAHALPPQPLDSPDRIAAQRETVRRLDAALLSLPEPFLGTLLQRYFEGLTPTQIAERERVPLPTVKSRLARGLELLRAELDDEPEWRASLAVALGLPSPAGPVAPALPVSVAATFALAVLTGVAALLWLGTGDRAPSGDAMAANVLGDAPREGGRADASPSTAGNTADPLVRSESVRRSQAEPATVRGRIVDEAGAPVAGVRAVLEGTDRDEGRRLPMDPPPAEAHSEVTTGTDGAFALDATDVEAKHYRLSFESPLRVELIAESPPLRAGRTLDLGDVTMPVGTIVRGRVVDDLGQPIANCEVWMESARNFGDRPLPKWAQHFRTDASGGFQSSPRRLASATYTVSVVLRDVRESRLVVSNVGEQLVEIVVAHLDPQSLLSGTVLDDLGRPLQGVRVEALTSAVVPTWALTDAHGRFEARQTEGMTSDAVALRLTRPDMLPFETSERFAWGRTDLQLVIPHPPGFRLRVLREEDDTPVEQFRAFVVAGTRSDEFRPRTHGHHPEGRALLHGIALGPARILVEPTGEELATSRFTTVEVEPDDGLEWIVRVPRLARRLLVLRTPNGTPVAGAEVQLVDRVDLPSTTEAVALRIDDWWRTSATKALLLATFVTDENGEALVSGPSDRRLEVRLPGPRHVATAIPDVDLADATALEVTVNVGAQLRARFTDEGAVDALAALIDLPPGAGFAPDDPRVPELRLWRNDHGTRTTTPSNGRALRLSPSGVFECDGLEVGTWNVELVYYRRSGAMFGALPGSTQAKEPMGTVVLHDGARAELTLDATFLVFGTIVGTVQHRGAALANARLALISGEGRGDQVVTTDATGSFTTSLRAGTYRLQWQARPFAELLADAPAVAIAGRRNEQTFRFPAASASIRVVDAASRPVTGVALHLRDETGALRRVLPVTDADGMVTDDLPLGAFGVHVLPRSLCDEAARAQWLEQRRGQADPFAGAWVSAGNLTTRDETAQTIELRLPPEFDR